MRNQLFIILLVPILSFSQKEYDFDYLITYESIFNDSIKKSSKQFLTNSKDNSYFAIISKKSESESELHFTDQNGIHLNVFFNNTELTNAEIINIKCKFVFNFKNDTKKYKNHYDYNILNNPKSEGENSYDYKLQPINEKRARRKKVGTYKYMLLDTLKLHLPILISHLEFEEWKSNPIIPNGIFKERIFVNYLGNIEHQYILIKIEEITKKIIIPSNCEL